jgi:hypothetical protein
MKSGGKYGVYQPNTNMVKVNGEWQLPSDIPSVNLSKCDYDKSRKVLKLVSEYIGMPRQFFVKSHHTGKEVRFVAVGPEDKLFNEDGWDGEMCVYRPAGGNVPGVDHLVIYHAY